MKSLIIALCWICPLASMAQLSFLSKTPLEFLLVKDNITLDTLKIFLVNSGPAGDFTQHTFEYDDQLRKIGHDYRFLIDGVAFPSRNESFEYLSDKELRTIQFDGNGGFVNWIRETDFFDPEIGEDVSLLENWNEDSQLWMNATKNVRTFIANGFFRDFIYGWNMNQMAYELIGKEELSILGDTKTTTYFSYDSDQQFVLDHRRTEEFIAPDGVQILDHRETYEDGDWSSDSKDELFLDVANLRGHQLNTNHFDETTGQAIISDSISFYLTDALQPKEARYYEGQTQGGAYTFEGLRKFKYRVDGLIALEDYFENGDTGLVHTEHREYIYSQQDSIVAVHSIESNFDVELQFANPANSTTTVFVAGEQTATPFDFWLIDAQGKILHQQSVMADDQISLAPLALSPGIYFMTLFKQEGGQKTWKLLKQ